ncbi:MAG: hypothetical protein KC592_08455 [Nitrospira sp.]|nr:hypothetical protein [Nitrospira sp.]HNP27512.1 hypothetical protein [Nitrospirales bacterium]
MFLPLDDLLAERESTSAVWQQIQEAVPQAPTHGWVSPGTLLTVLGLNYGKVALKKWDGVNPQDPPACSIAIEEPL